jgi:hypothetical protein
MKKKLISAIAMLTVSAVTLSTATYAWFTMNKEVTVTGMQVRTKVSENLLIADDTLASTARKADNLFYNALVQTHDALLEPVSTDDGTNYFYTKTDNVIGTGDAMNDVYIAYNAADTSAFNTNYGTTGAVGYVDYVYQLKAITGSDAQEIRLTGLDLTYGGASPANNQKAYRAGVFVENLGYMTSTDSSNLIAPAGGVGTLQAIYTPSGAANFTPGFAVDSTSTVTGAVTYNSQFALATQANATNYYKVVVRVWLEGEDTTCNNTTFMSLKDKWSVDMKWDLVGTSESAAAYNKVANINLAYTATKADLSSATAAAGAVYTINGQEYFKINTVQLNSTDLYTTAAGAVTSSSKIYTIRDGLYPTDVTNQCTLPAPVAP